MDASEEAEGKIEVLPSTETDAGAGDGVTEDQSAGMRAVLDRLMSYRKEDGSDPSRVFHKRVNKRNIPGYYDVIKEPMAFSNIRQSVEKEEYQDFPAFVRDCALIWHNAYLFNRSESEVYQDATIMKALMEEEFKKLVEGQVVSADDIVWPDLGEIPPEEDLPEEEEEDDEEDADDGDEEEDDEEDGDDSDDAAGRRKSKRRPSESKRDSATKGDSQKGEQEKKKRGRPPKVDTPMEARIKNVIKGLRKFKDKAGNIMIVDFEKLRDKSVMPEYYQEIKNPMSIELIKKNQKRKRYNSVDHFMRDIDLMFNNAKEYNRDDSELHVNAVTLQKEAQKLAAAEKQKSDSDFAMDEGKKPRPEGLTHNDKIWKVGDWVHIKNQNDVNKPIVAQIYRTWEDASGQGWVNACWYYRPEQTVHHFEKHFYEHEVVKTGQYRDHPIDDVLDRCFVMFVTRYFRGRPSGLAPNAQVYVCECRYNEERHKLNKIKTWASCLPDEVRDNDYEWTQYPNGARKDKKKPSPLLYLVDDDTVEKKDQPVPGQGNAPPIRGGIRLGPREENQSPPPMATPTPPPQAPPALPRQVTQTPTQEASAYGRPSSANTNMDENHRVASATPVASQGAYGHPSSSYSAQRMHDHQSSGSPAPMRAHPQAQPGASYPQAQHVTYPPSTPVGYGDHYGGQAQRHPQQQGGPRPYPPGAMPQGYPTPEVFLVVDATNIPERVRNQYQQDEKGNLLFFSTPPLDVLPPTNDGPPLRHSIKYRAAKLRQNLERKMKREAEEKAAEGERAAKRQQTSTATPQEASEPGTAQSQHAPGSSATAGRPIEGTNIVLPPDLAKVWDDFCIEFEKGTDDLFKQLHGDRWLEEKIRALEFVHGNMLKANERAKLKKEETKEEKHKREFREMEEMMKPPKGGYLDDYDDRLGNFTA